MNSTTDATYRRASPQFTGHVERRSILPGHERAYAAALSEIARKIGSRVQVEAIDHAELLAHLDAPRGIA